MQACKACKKTHYGFCEEKSVPLSTRIKAGKWVDGDRVPDYWEPVLGGTSEKVLSEVSAMERKIKRLETELRGYKP